MTKDKGPKSKGRYTLPQAKRVPSVSARVAALKMLARREYSEAQIRYRLARQGHEDAAIDEAVARLKTDGAVDDARVAKAVARMATSVKRRGKHRVMQQLAHAGIARDVVQQTVDETFASLDSEQLIDASLGKRLRDGRTIADDKEFRRLYRYLSAQGFESDQIVEALSKRRR